MPDEVSDAQPEPFQYYVDTISEEQITGWIQRRDKPSQRCVVALRQGDQVLARAAASQFRADLTWAGIGDGCYSFVMPMPAAVLDGAEHILDIVEEDSGFSLVAEPILWRAAKTQSRMHSNPAAQGAVVERANKAWLDTLDPNSSLTPTRAPPEAALSAPGTRSPAGRPAASSEPGTRILFDISDLVFYLGHHPNVTGIQRVQSGIALAVLKNQLIPQSRVAFLSYNQDGAGWVIIPTGFICALLEDLLHPETARYVTFSKDEAKRGLLPGARKFDGTGWLDDGQPSVLCVIGAVWVWPDYFHQVLALKRRFGTRLVLEMHDLIPIYARETCDQDTVRVFERFLRRALRHVDHFLATSEATKRDIVRYAAGKGLPAPSVTVVQNGSAMDEFWERDASTADGGLGEKIRWRELPDRFVLFVSTIEGRKNHQLMLRVWRRMVEAGADPPHLVCVGRVGWRSEPFITELIETDYLDGRVILLHDIADSELRDLFSRCLFTVFPSLYEGWGLPIAESLAAGKICVCSDRASLPEVAGDLGVYINIDDPEQCYTVIRGLIDDPAARHTLEARIGNDYRPITWRSVSERVLAACERATTIDWDEPYPHPRLPYSTEISFSRLEREVRGQTGDEMLLGIASARRGHFLSASLDEASFVLGEDIRDGENWAEPEDWGTWSCRAGGEIAARLPPSDGPVHFVFLRLSVIPVLADVPIIVSANGEPGWHGTVGQLPCDLFFTVRRRGDPNKDWRLRIRTEVKLNDDQLSRIGEIDGRLPTIGFRRLVVVPENDLRARIDILSNLVLQRGL